MESAAYMKVDASRARLMRVDTAELLTRLFYLERSLILNQAGWLPAVGRLEAKGALARTLWEGSLTAGELRKRILELRYPNRLMTSEAHRSAVEVFDAARHAPGPEAFILALAEVLLPALVRTYRELFRLSDRLSDGPTARLLKHALADKKEQITGLKVEAGHLLASEPGQRKEAQEWTRAVGATLAALGTSLLEPALRHAPALIAGSRNFAPAAVPARDGRFRRVRFYWPHVVDPDFPSTDGIHLQMRSAIGHLNEVWAAEICAVNLYNYAGDLGWEFIRDLARWTYDESRHSLMGLQRLLEWGFRPDELPLGDYIYVAARRQEPIYGLGMIYALETKYMSRGRKRIETFTRSKDLLSRHDYEFDWADETFHAEYGTRWLTELIEGRSAPPGDLRDIRGQCEELLAAEAAGATPQEVREITDIARALLEKAESRASLPR